MNPATAEALPPGYKHFHTSKFVLAADLGQSVDPTAICVIEHQTQGVDHYVKGPVRHVADRFDVRYLARLPLGLSYPEVVAEVGRLLHRPPLADDCELVVDETGVGRAVADIFDNAGLRPPRVTITAGSEQTQHSGRSWHVPKQVLISTLDARLHTGELKFAAELGEASAMQNELKDFRRKVSVAGRYTFEARVGQHDDLVFAVAIGLWSLVGRPNQAAAISRQDFFERKTTMPNDQKLQAFLSRLAVKGKPHPKMEETVRGAFNIADTFAVAWRYRKKSRSHGPGQARRDCQAPGQRIRRLVGEAP